MGFFTPHGDCGSLLLKRKENSSQDRRRCLEVHLCCHLFLCARTHASPPEGKKAHSAQNTEISKLWFSNFKLIPFRPTAGPVLNETASLALNLRPRYTKEKHFFCRAPALFYGTDAHKKKTPQEHHPAKNFLNAVTQCLRIYYLGTYCLAHGTFLHFGLLRSQLNRCDYFQDLH